MRGGRAETFSERERRRASDWKRSSLTLPDEARRSAPYINKKGMPSQRDYDFCLPSKFAEHSLLPEVRAPVLALFAELGIPWHDGVAGGPSNHLVSSQVQCANALGAMVNDSARVRHAFGDVLRTSEVLEIEPERFLTFEYIGPTDYFGEAPRGERTRGAHCTSVDAAFLHRTTDGAVELILIEWKYTESYRARRPQPAKDRTRWSRYGSALSAEAGPVRGELIAFDALLQEPLYQLMRQQLLAFELEKSGAHGADRVRVVHVSPRMNVAFQASVQPAAKELGQTVGEAWQRLLRHHDRFVSFDSAVFCDPLITSAEYVERYGPTDEAIK